MPALRTRAALEAWCTLLPPRFNLKERNYHHDLVWLGRNEACDLWWLVDYDHGVGIDPISGANCRHAACEKLALQRARKLRVVPVAPKPLPQLRGGDRAFPTPHNGRNTERRR